MLQIYPINMKTHWLMFAALFLLSASFIQAGQKAHVHGSSNLTVALENETLVVRIDSPLMDLVGFENEPKTKIQKGLLERAKEQLQKSDEVLVFKGGSCVEQKSIVNLGHVHTKNASNAEHDHSSHNDNHREISAFYEFRCSKPKSLKQIEVLLFEEFPGMEKIKARWVNFDTQGEQTLLKNKNIINFK